MSVFKRFPVVVLERIAVKDCPEASRRIPKEIKKEVGSKLSKVVVKNESVSDALPKRNVRKQVNAPHDVKYKKATSFPSEDDSCRSKEAFLSDLVVDVKIEKEDSVTHELVGYSSHYSSGENHTPLLKIKTENIETKNCSHEPNVRFNHNLDNRPTIYPRRGSLNLSEIQSKVHLSLKHIGLAYASVRLEDLSSRILNCNRNSSTNCLDRHRNNFSAESFSGNLKTESSLKAKSSLQCCGNRFDCTTSNGSNKNFSVSEEVAKGDCNEKLYQCEVCFRKFKHHLRRHMLTHSDEAPYQCKQCPKRFKRSDHLKKHLTVHSDEKAFKCSRCPKQFTRTDRFSNHLREHGERPYKCRRCPETFLQWFDLRIHLRVHRGERRFSCHQCPKTFCRNADLRSHLKAHTGERPFACNQCSAKFARKGNLDSHLRMHNGEKPFSCNQCCAKFAQKGSLSVHSRLHSGEKPYICSQCSKKFRYKSTLNSHLREHYRD